MNENHEALKQPNLKYMEQRLEQLFVLMDLIKKDLSSSNQAEVIHAVLGISTLCDFIEDENGFIKHIYDKHDNLRSKIEKIKAGLH